MFPVLFMLPELFSLYKAMFLFTILQNIILDYAKEPCLNICLK